MYSEGVYSVVVYSEGVCHGDELFIMFKPRALPVDSSRNPEDRKVRKSSPVISGLKSWILRPGGHCIGLNMRGGYFMGLNHIANTVHKFEAEGSGGCLPWPEWQAVCPLLQFLRQSEGGTLSRDAPTLCQPLSRVGVDRIGEILFVIWEHIRIYLVASICGCVVAVANFN